MSGYDEWKLATPPEYDEPPNYCDCERSANGIGLAGRECDCPAGVRNSPQISDSPQHDEHVEAYFRSLF